MEHLFGENVIHLAELDSTNGFHGQNGKQMLVLYRKNAADEAQPPLLKNILTAIGIDLEADTLYLAMQAHEGVPLAAICRQYKIKTVFIFGVPLLSLGLKLELPFNQVVSFMGLSILRTDGLVDLDQNKEKKLVLWKELQTFKK